MRYLRSKNFWHRPSLLIFKAPHTKAVHPVVVVHPGTTTAEVQAVGVRSILGTTPIVAAATSVAEPAITATAVACRRQF